MRKFGFGSLLLLFGVLVLGLPTLAQPSDMPLIVPDSNFPDGPGKQGGNYVTSTTTDPTYLNPFLATGDQASTDVTNLAGVTFGAPLAAFSGDPIAVLNDMAQSFEIDNLDNPTTVTIKLRPGLKWSDGQPITSADAQFTFMANTDPRYAEVARSDTLLINDQ